MNWNQVTIFTSQQGMEIVAARLDGLGIDQTGACGAVCTGKI